MPMLRNVFRVSLAALAFTVAAASATADIVSYDMFGQPGDQVSTAATFVDPGVTGVNLARGAGLTVVSGANSINASGWSTSADDFYVLGFDLLPGFTAMVNNFTFGARSSNTGPGFINVFTSVDGGAESLLTSIALVGTTFNNQDLAFGPLAVNSSLRVYFRAANTTSANGGTIGTAGTFRLGDYFDGTTFGDIKLGGTVAIPEPSPTLLGGLVAAGFLVVSRARKHLAAR